VDCFPLSMLVVVGRFVGLLVCKIGPDLLGI